MKCKHKDCENECEGFGKTCKTCRESEKATRAAVRTEYGVCSYIGTNSNPCKRVRVSGTMFCAYHSEEWQARAANDVQKSIVAKIASKNEAVVGLDAQIAAMRIKVNEATYERSNILRAVDEFRAKLTALKLEAESWAPEPMLAQAAALAAADAVGNAQAICALTELAKEARLARAAKSKVQPRYQRNSFGD